MIAKLIPFFIAAPLLGAFLSALLGRKYKRFPEAVSLFVTGSLFILSIFALRSTVNGGVALHYLGGWRHPVGILIGGDGLTMFMLATVHLVAFCIGLYSVSYMKKYTSSWTFHLLFLVILAGMNGVLTTCDFFNLFVFMEISSLAACTLVAFGTEKHELEAAFKYCVMNTVGALLILIGIAFLYGVTSTLNMAEMANLLAGQGSSKAVLFASVLFVAGFGLKAAIVPFHAWLPDAHPSAPAPISAMLSGLIIKCLGIYSLFRIFFCVLGLSPEMSSILLFLGALSMGTGAFLAVGQTDMKRLLAYSSLSQIGYIVTGFALGTPLGILGSIFHIFNHSVGKSLLFLTAGSVEYATGTRNLDEMGGLGKKMPVTGASGLIGAMSISGIPPFAGFFSKLLIIFAAVQAGRWGYAIWAVLAGVLTLGYLMRGITKAFRGGLSERWSAVQEVPVPMRCAMILLAVFCVTGGLLLVPGVREFFLQQAADVLLRGAEYARIWEGI